MNQEIFKVEIEFGNKVRIVNRDNYLLKRVKKLTTADSIDSGHRELVQANRALEDTISRRKQSNFGVIVDPSDNSVKK